MAYERSQKRQMRTVFLVCNGRHIRKGTRRPGTSSGFVCTTSVALWFLEAPEVMIAFFIALNLLFGHIFLAASFHAHSSCFCRSVRSATCSVPMRGRWKGIGLFKVAFHVARWELTSSQASRRKLARNLKLLKLYSAPFV
ncbi:hypothetical protein LZ32DRAFT_311753 [Colletotrichum eremochloae]|nr:hypothetical protein LZ32DRAFT_311753 [Colletotrichum eremochloae]